MLYVNNFIDQSTAVGNKSTKNVIFPFIIVPWMDLVIVTFVTISSVYFIKKSKVFGQRLPTISRCSDSLDFSAQVCLKFQSIFNQTSRYKVGGVILGIAVIIVTSIIHLVIAIEKNYPPAPLLTSKLQMYFSNLKFNFVCGKSNSIQITNSSVGSRLCL